MIFLLIVLVGLGLLNYPYLSSRYSQREYRAQFEAYQQEMESTQQDSQRQQAQQYNQQLSTEQSALEDAFSSQQPSGGEEGLLGYVEIEKIDVYLPIYEGTTEQILRKGIGHLSGSSLPVGGESTHAVLAGHSGLASQLMFTELEQLEIGDRFSLYVMGEELCYQVDQILTVEPWQTDALQIEEGKDMVTLITCVPYGVNSHRLLVRGQRVETEETQEQTTAVSTAEQPDEPSDTPKVSSQTQRRQLIFWASTAVWLLLVLITVGTQIRARYQKKHQR